MFAKSLAIGLALVLGMTALTLWGRPTQAVADRLHLRAEAVALPNGQVEVTITWHWAPMNELPWRWRDQLLAISFDTREAIFEEEVAPFGVGASGPALQRLEQVAGPNGARRLYVLPEARDGQVRARFRPVWPGRSVPAAPFSVQLVPGVPFEAIRTIQPVIRFISPEKDFGRRRVES